MSSSSAPGRRPDPSRSAKIIALPRPRKPRRRQTAIRFALVALLMMLVGAVAMRAYLTRYVPAEPNGVAGVSADEAQVLGLINQERLRNGLRPLLFDARLAVAARGHSYDMAIRHYLDHISPDGLSPADRAKGLGIAFELMGENVYMEPNPDHAQMPERAVNGWMSSEHHRANILSSDFTKTAVGIAYSSQGEGYITQEFLR